MHIPRRVPWANIAELDQVAGWIYDPDSTPADCTRAQHRLAAWAHATPLPASLAAAHALLAALALDASASPAPALTLRHAYAMALTRLVNGLVDPLQQGMYARPIAHIARQLGVPAWWVELRHASTHEDLPGLLVLREAAHEALDWLYTNYFLPTLHSSLPPGTPYAYPAPYPSPAPLLKSYKALAKLITRDASLAQKNRAEVDRVLRDFERWVAEVRLGVASAGGGEGWGVGAGAEGEGDEVERAALEVVCEALVEKGALVPVSRRKRPTLKDPTLPPELSALWHRLLAHLQSHHPAFAASLYASILARLASPPAPASAPTGAAGDGAADMDPTYDACLVGWGVWAVAQWEEEVGGREEAVRMACVGLGECEDGRRQALRTLVSQLCVGDPALEQRAGLLMGIVGTSRVSGWEDGDVDLIDSRLRQLEAALKPPSAPPMTVPAMDVPPAQAESAPPGWRRLTPQEWTERPIGWVEVG